MYRIIDHIGVVQVKEMRVGGKGPDIGRARRDAATLTLVERALCLWFFPDSSTMSARPYSTLYFRLYPNRDFTGETISCIETLC